MKNTLIIQRENLSLPVLISDAGVARQHDLLSSSPPRSETRIPGRHIFERRPGLCTGVKKERLA
ncbi:hypothetical protein [Nitrosomonas aestuarii]|uniref:hypothetical protein n=1 Tax=Nitrosomonas aestuarii TaxID=52441 RepID=UPI000D45172C|nr:hypothetical protein [Nitrosomonas aestuarii]PTN08428.1 hypothetical protein C8R11_1287 [Nitrosomonas aestuarii]